MLPQLTVPRQVRVLRVCRPALSAPHHGPSSAHTHCPLTPIPHPPPLHRHQDEGAERGGYDERSEGVSAATLHDSSSGCRTAPHRHPAQKGPRQSFHWCVRACVCLCAHSVYKCSVTVLLPPCAPVALSPSTPCVAMARLGAEDQVIVHCPLSAMLEVELGPPLHSLVVVGHTHPLEQEMLALFTKHT